MIAFISVFFSSRKTVFKSLLDTSSTPGYLSSFQAFSYCKLDTSSTPGGSIKKVLIPSIVSRHLVDRSNLIFCVWCFVPRHLLDTCIYQRPNPRHLYLSSFNEVLFILPHAIQTSFLSISLSITLSLHLLNLYLSLQTSTRWFFKLFQVFLHLVSF